MQFDTAGDGNRQARTKMYVTEGDGARSGKMCRYCGVRTIFNLLLVCSDDFGNHVELELAAQKVVRTVGVVALYPNDYSYL